MKILCLLFITFTINIKAEDGLKVTDYQNKAADTKQVQTTSSPELNPEQIKDMQKQIEQIKANEKKTNDLLQDLDKDL